MENDRKYNEKQFIQNAKRRNVGEWAGVKITYCSSLLFVYEEFCPVAKCRGLTVNLVADLIVGLFVKGFGFVVERRKVGWAEDDQI